MKSLTHHLLQLAFLAFCSFTPSAFAQGIVDDLDDTEVDSVAYTWEDIAQQFPDYLKAAKKGDVEAMNYVAFCYQQGLGVDADVKQVIKWYTKAAKEGDIHAMRELVSIYLYGISSFSESEEGASKTKSYQDMKKAVKWVNKAAEAGDPSSYEVMMLYYLGHVEPADYNEAIKWARKAAEAGHVTSMMALGEYYLEGIVVEKNVPEALKWLQMAADNGSEQALSTLLRCYLTDEYGVKDCDKAIDCLNKAADEGSIYAMISLGRVYCKDDYTTPNIPEARRWFGKAEQALIAQGDEINAEHLVHLAKCYLLGVGNMKADKAKAENLLGLLEICAEERRYSDIGDLYYEGKEISRNYLEALRWYKKAAAAHDFYSAHKVGMMYLRGEGVLTNAHEAVKWLEKSEWYGYYDLGMCYYNGTGVEKDCEHAIELLQMACTAGSDEAVQFLESIGVEPEEL